jgi:hypothetical protein
MWKMHSTHKVATKDGTNTWLWQSGFDGTIPPAEPLPCPFGADAVQVFASVFPVAPKVRQPQRAPALQLVLEKLPTIHTLWQTLTGTEESTITTVQVGMVTGRKRQRSASPKR